MKVSDKGLALVQECDGWHVDTVSRDELVLLVEPKNPIHSFAGSS